MGIEQNTREVILTFLGTGYSRAINNYNACFTIENNGKYFLIDSGGGNGLLSQLSKAKIELELIRDIFISHFHMDHFLGAIWFFKEIIKRFKETDHTYTINLYCDEATVKPLQESMALLIGSDYKKYERYFKIIKIEYSYKYTIIGLDFKFFDLYPTKVAQTGFYFYIGNKKISFTGDEKINKAVYSYIYKSNTLISEALCLEEDKKRFRPDKSNQSTVKEIAELAENLKISHLILIHTEDISANRVNKYQTQVQEHFRGSVMIPKDFQKYKVIK